MEYPINGSHKVHERTRPTCTSMSSLQEPGHWMLQITLGSCFTFNQGKPLVRLLYARHPVMVVLVGCERNVLTFSNLHCTDLVYKLLYN